MLRSNLFSRATAYTGILACALSLSDYVRVIVAPSALTLTLVIAFASAIFLFLWAILVALQLLKMGRAISKESRTNLPNARS